MFEHYVPGPEQGEDNGRTIHPITDL